MKTAHFQIRQKKLHTPENGLDEDPERLDVHQRHEALAEVHLQPPQQRPEHLPPLVAHPLVRRLVRVHFRRVVGEVPDEELVLAALVPELVDDLLEQRHPEQQVLVVLHYQPGRKHQLFVRTRKCSYKQDEK